VSNLNELIQVAGRCCQWDYRDATKTWLRTQLSVKLSSFNELHSQRTPYLICVITECHTCGAVIIVGFVLNMN